MKLHSKLSVLAASVLLATPMLAMASNPIIKHIYTADPAAIVDDDTVYIYTGHDEAGTDESAYVMDDWHVFSSKDLVNWTDHGEVLSLEDFSWASADAWAGQVIKRDDKYYWYVPVNDDTDGWFGIGVAVSDSPTGPFVDAIGSALITDSMTPNETLDIDPTVFIDDDGQAYLYWGNATDDGIIKVVKLKDNMIETDGDITDIDTDQVPSFTEAPYMHERNGIYYLSYAAGWPENIYYSTADNPMGPFTYQGMILDADDVSSPTSHQSIIEYHDNWYLVYHNADLPDGGEYRRSVAMDRLYYNDDGTIQQVTPTTDGVGVDGLGGEYVLKNRLSDKCLQPLDGATSNGTQIVQHTCDDDDTQHWDLTHTLDDTYQITHQESGKVLDISQGSVANGARAILWANYDGDNQYWQLDSQSDDDEIYDVTNYNSQLLLETADALLDEDANVGQWSNNGGYQQQWWFLRPEATQIEPVSYEGYYLSYRANGVWMESSPSPLDSSQFRIESGLADSSGISFASITRPGYYLRHRGFVLYMEYDNGSDDFDEDATFYRQEGLSDSSAVSYESYNYPGYYIRHQYYQLRVDPESDIDDTSDATFNEISD
ncbi:Ricin-type beta-trefoil lectin domain-like [Vibrio xiamenensis]|uniref:Ricin-type beta-trefoil lectin domain-like n=1 Tax=Vibrio xiamenensis TaxID=861298 RepID=A0A1G8AM27_9VIBR|nr:family 43 glycosylhydrolase [Vibrio xiamenensis]SDH21957.1 Ricin-type beta-trefoil lectin domain-like [Vibrio xiamenensis]